MSTVEVSSTGSLGFEFRSDERAYLNYPIFVNAVNADEFAASIENTMEYVGRINTNDPSHSLITRAVVRATVDSRVLSGLLRDPLLKSLLEGAIDLKGYVGGSREHIVYFGLNAKDRAPSQGMQLEFLDRVEKASHLTEAHAHWDPPSTYALNNSVKDDAELFGLWGGTFGWSSDGCADFADRLWANRRQAPHQRSTWFTGMEVEGELVACAMAERLDIPGRKRDIALVEHTEWATREDFRGRGLGQIVVKSLIGDIQSDLVHTDHLIFAECNILSGAHRVGLRSGFVVPKSNLRDAQPSQILYQNVRVGDGLRVPYEYRNFLLLAAK